VKDSIYEQLSRVTKALSNPKRIEILDLLSQSEKTVEMISEQADLGVKNASAQLKELKSALLVESRKEGKYVFYSLTNQGTAHFLSALRDFGEKQFLELQNITREAFNSDDDLEEVDRKQVIAKVKRGDTILIDVRPVDEFDHAHLPNAMSVPISELTQKMRSLPKGREIVAYCRGPYCFFAKDAVVLLRKKGFKAKRLKDSVSDWELLGLPVSKLKAV